MVSMAEATDCLGVGTLMAAAANRCSGSGSSGVAAGAVAVSAAAAVLAAALVSAAVAAQQGWRC